MVHACPASGEGTERVFTAAGNQDDDLKKHTMDKTLESTLNAGMNTKLTTCDAEGALPAIILPSAAFCGLAWSQFLHGGVGKEHDARCYYAKHCGAECGKSGLAAPLHL